MPPLKVVFDTNIFVMAAGMPGGYIDYWLDMATPPGNKLINPHRYGNNQSIRERTEARC